jgi:hypothetical protein
MGKHHIKKSRSEGFTLNEEISLVCKFGRHITLLLKSEIMRVYISPMPCHLCTGKYCPSPCMTCFMLLTSPLKAPLFVFCVLRYGLLFGL